MKKIQRDVLVGDSHAVTIFNPLGESFRVPLDGIAIDLHAVVSVENPFDTVERILCRMVGTQVGDRFDVVSLFVEQLRHIAVNGTVKLHLLS